MSSLSASQLLAVWECGVGQLPVQRALSLLAAAFPDESLGDLADLSIGQRDGRLLKLREQLFGSQVTSLTDCPACGERVETSFRVSDILLEHDSLSGTEGLVADLDGYHLRFRPPNSRDLLLSVERPYSTTPELRASGNREERRQVLAEQCVLEAVHEGQSIRPADLPEVVFGALGRRMIDADPLAEVMLSLTCPACGHVWQALFDIASYFWSEIDAWAYRTLQEIHCLARAYGWSEAEILALSPWRRWYYLSLL